MCVVSVCVWVCDAETAFHRVCKLDASAMSYKRKLIELKVQLARMCDVVEDPFAKQDMLETFNADLRSFMRIMSSCTEQILSSRSATSNFSPSVLLGNSTSGNLTSGT